MSKKNKSVSAIYSDEMAKPSKPSVNMRVYADMLPSIKDMNIDEERTFTIKGKVTSIEKMEYDGGKLCCSLQVTSIKEVNK